MARHAPVFHVEAAKLGIELQADVKLPWLTRHGHLVPAVQDRLPATTLAALDAILDALSGDAAALAAKTRGSMTADFVLLANAAQVEYDEVQHFTSARALTFELYPDDAALAFDPGKYAATVERWRAKGDKGFAHKEAAEFPGRAGRQRQRAYFDAFRDLTASHFGNGPLHRIAAPADDYAQAARRLADSVAGPARRTGLGNA